MKKNIRYKSKQLVEFYKDNRQKWEDLYPSEKKVFEKLAFGGKSLGDVLDVGCACGGLGTALREKNLISSYVGIDINKNVISWAKKNFKEKPLFYFIEGDIVEDNINEEFFDTVVSLSCADWNIQTEKIVKACWARVKLGGNLVISLRLTDEKGVNDICKSFQFVNFSGKEKKPETANYVVLNLKDALAMFKGLKPSPRTIDSYGYWGKPSSTAVTPFKKIVFSVFYLQKGPKGFKGRAEVKCDLPIA